MVDPALEAEIASLTIDELETKLFEAFWHYLRDKLWKQPKYLIRHLDHMTAIIDKMRRACEQEQCPPIDTYEKRKAHEARVLGWSLVWHADLIGQGKGDSPKLDPQTKKPATYKKRPVTILDWVNQFLNLDAHPIQEALLKQDDLGRILQWKVDLLSAFTEARKLYNAYQPRADSKDPASTHDRKRLGRHEAGKLITEAMRVVYRSHTRPLPEGVEAQAQEALDHVLGRAATPLEAVIPLVKRLANDKLKKAISADTVRQAAERERDNKPPRSNGLTIEINGVPRIRSSGGVSGAINKAKMTLQLWKNQQGGSSRKKRSVKPAVITD
mgnify:CR=1 FL=1|jgi:hypothetical protein